MSPKSALWQPNLRRKPCHLSVARQPVRYWRDRSHESVRIEKIDPSVAILHRYFAGSSALAQDALSLPQAAATPAASGLPAQIPRRSRPLRLRGRRLGYMRVVIRAQRRFNKQYGHFATIAPGTRTLRHLHQAHGQHRPRRLHGELQGKERQLRPHHDSEDIWTRSTDPSTPKTTQRSTPTTPSPPTETPR